MHCRAVDGVALELLALRLVLSQTFEKFEAKPIFGPTYAASAAKVWKAVVPFAGI